MVSARLGWTGWIVDENVGCSEVIRALAWLGIYGLANNQEVRISVELGAEKSDQYGYGGCGISTIVLSVVYNNRVLNKLFK